MLEKIEKLGEKLESKSVQDKLKKNIDLGNNIFKLIFLIILLALTISFL